MNLAAISTVHQSRGYLAFFAFDGIIWLLTFAWHQVVSTCPSIASLIVVTAIFPIFDLGLSTSDT